MKLQPKPATASKRKAATAKPQGESATRSPLPLNNMQRKALSKVEHCREELARVYREARAGKLDIADASRLANILSILSRMIEGGELEKQLDEVLERLDRIEGGKA